MKNIFEILNKKCASNLVNVRKLHASSNHTCTAKCGQL